MQRMMMAASCPKPDSEDSVHSLAAFDENKAAGIGAFLLPLEIFFLKARTVISPLPDSRPWSSAVMLFFYLLQKFKNTFTPSLPEAGTILHLYGYRAPEQDIPHGSFLNFVK